MKLFLFCYCTRTWPDREPCQYLLFLCVLLFLFICFAPQVLSLVLLTKWHGLGNNKTAIWFCWEIKNTWSGSGAAKTSLGLDKIHLVLFDKTLWFGLKNMPFSQHWTCITWTFSEGWKALRPSFPICEQGTEQLPPSTSLKLCKTTDIIMKQFVFTKNSWCLKCLIVGWGVEGELIPSESLSLNATRKRMVCRVQDNYCQTRSNSQRTTWA